MVRDFDRPQAQQTKAVTGSIERIRTTAKTGPSPAQKDGPATAECQQRPRNEAKQANKKDSIVTQERFDHDYQL